MLLLPAVALQLLAATHSSLATETIPNDTPVHLGISLQLTHPDELAQLRAGQADPRSADFRRWLTPQEFGERFGQPRDRYAQLVGWLQHGGLEVTAYPSRAFLEARGSAAQIEALLEVQLEPVDGEAFAVHTPATPARIPDAFSSMVLHVSGLDTRVRFHHHINMPTGMASLGPQDLRHLYGLQPLLDQGFVGQGQKLVVLSTALPPGKGASRIAIEYFFRNISDATAVFVERKLPNPQNDLDNQAGGNLEFELDAQMQSVGSPGADSITLEIAPASEVFTTGANDIANNLASATAVSISLGLCEQGEQQNGGTEITALRNAVIQGVTEGQTWSAASGDNGANDCRNGTLVAVDFPSSIPEMVAAGGSELKPAMFDLNHAITAYQQEVAWNDGNQGGAAGGGISIIFQRPAYQQGLSLPGTGRSVPDIALMSGLPAVAVASALPPGELGPVEGTSVASPLSAGFFGLIASRVGCRLGDVHAALYALGNAQTDGGSAVFHDITSGNLTNGGVTGPSAGPGYDSATGWGSLDVAAIAAAWPPCPALPDGGSQVADAGLLVAYTQCGFLGCDAGCTTVPEGPSTCSPTCTPGVTGTCASGTVCSQDTVYTTATTGSCVPGCDTNADCASQPGTVCSTCSQQCVPMGTATSKVGDGCTSSLQCPSGAYCSTSRTLGATGAGYCTFDCQQGVAAGSACACPSGSQCGRIGRNFATYVCLATCTGIGSVCRTNYLCQPQNTGTPSCLPKCTISNRNGTLFDSCASLGTTKACDLDSGICGGPVGGADAGTPDAGGVDAGADAGPINPPDPVQVPLASDTLGAPIGGCGCGATSPAPLFLTGLFALGLARRRARAG